MGNKIGVPIAQGLDVPAFFKDVSNFVNDIKGAKVRSNVGNDLPSLLEGL